MTLYDSAERLRLDDPGALAMAASALAGGAVVGHAFANFYVLTTRPDENTVRAVNLLKGRPPGQVGSITTTPSRIPLVWDWQQVPATVTRHELLGVLDTLFELGPFGFRGPAARHVPDHLTQLDGGIRTAQVIAPGYRCPSNAFLTSALRAAGTDLLHATSANRSRHMSGVEDEPAHFAAAGLRAEFGGDPRFLMLEHPDEAAARDRYPEFAPMSTTILAFHRLPPPERGRRRRRLVVERHGSFPLDRLREVLDPLGFDLTLGPYARERLVPRVYG